MTLTAISRPWTARSTRAVSPYAKASTIARGSSAASRTRLTPSAEPPRDGLTTRGSPSCATMASSTRLAPSSRNRLCGSVTKAGVESPARLAIVLATGLLHATRLARGSVPRYRRPSSSRTSRTEPSSPVAPCRSGQTRSGRVCVSAGMRSASTSCTVTSIPAPRSASATRRPERSDTSRSCDRPPARTTTRGDEPRPPPARADECVEAAAVDGVVVGSAVGADVLGAGVTRSSRSGDGIDGMSGAVA